MESLKNIWPKTITVDKRIVKILSEQTYENFPNAIKELITNSYDADATRVDLVLNLEEERLIIEDNGWGMTDDEFNFYLRIAGKRREKADRNSSGRFIIGQFGVGFLSVFPFFKTFNIETKKRDSNEIVYASIPCYKYFSPDKTIDITDINIQGGVRYDNKRISESFTTITLAGFTEIGETFLYPPNDLKARKNSIYSFDSIRRFKWKLCEDLPLEYDNEKFDVFTSSFSPNIPFEVTFNKQKLRRPIYGSQTIDENLSVMQIGKIRFKYFIVTDRKSIVPNEARYLKVRNLNAGVGERTNFGLGTEVGGARSRLHWLSGEVIIMDGLNDIITVSRDGFNFNSDYEKLKEFFIKKLAYLSNQLEDEAELNRFLKQSKQVARINNLNYLKPQVVSDKLEKLKSIKSKSINEVYKGTQTNFEKKIVLKNKTYKVQLDKWDFKNDFFPAVKIDKSNVIINNNYPLFQGKKFTDVFVKFHLLLVLNLINKELKKSEYSKISSDILTIFEDYSK